jgi:hypothetical protein
MAIHLSRFIHTENGRMIMSILLGFGLASLFRAVCKDKDCIIFNAPPLEKINDKIYKYDNKCYKYSTKSVTCDKNKKIIDFGESMP